MRYLDDLTVGEIAVILDKKQNNVRVLLHRSLNALKEVLREEDNK